MSGPPALRVVRGDPTEEEVGALVAVLAAVARRRAAAAPAAALDAWSDRAALLAAPPRPGPGAWRAAALPR